MGLAGVSTSGHVPRHPVNARALRRGVAQLRDPPVDGLRHAAQLVSVGLAVLAEAPIGEPLVEGLRLHELLVPPPEQGVEVVARVHLAELPQHLRLVAPLEGHHPFTVHECFWQGAPCTGPAAACTGGPVLGRASSLQAPRAEPGPRAPREAREVEPSEAARAREPVLGRPLRPAPSSGASACFCFRAGGLCAWGLALRVSGGRPARARWQEPAQAPAQQALQPRDQALKPRGGPHCQPFPLVIILLVIVQENCKGNAGAAGIYHIAVHVCELKAQGAQGNGAVQFDEVALVGSCLHDVPHAFVDDHFADDILTQRPLDVGRRGQGAASEQQLRVRIHGHEGEDLQGAVDEGGPEQMGNAQGAAGRGARRVAFGAREEASDLIVVEDAAVAVVGDLDLVGGLHVGGRGVVAADPRGQPRPRVGSDGQHRPVEGLQGLIDPIEVLASVRRQKGVGHTELEDGELGPRLEVKGFPDVKLEGGVVSGDSLAAVDIDRSRHPFPLAPETPPRRLLGACVADLPGPLGAGPAGVHDAVGAGAAVDVVALTVAQRASPQELAHHLAQDRPHLPRICDRNAPKTCLLWALAC